MSYGGSAASSEAGEGPTTTGRARVPRSERGRLSFSHLQPYPEDHEVQPKILFKDDFLFQCVSIREGGG